MEFLRDSSNLTPQSEDTRWLQDLAFLPDLTAKRNELNTELQTEKKTIIKITKHHDRFKGTLTVVQDSVMKSVLTHFSRVR
jgi:hypothetical protein